jgi:hypothetical protein
VGRWFGSTAIAVTLLFLGACTPDGPQRPPDPVGDLLRADILRQCHDGVSPVTCVCLAHSLVSLMPQEVRGRFEAHEKGPSYKMTTNRTEVVVVTPAPWFTDPTGVASAVQSMCPKSPPVHFLLTESAPVSN